ncbi:MAG: CoA transferase, partial [Pseudomonadota bacterium]
IACGNDRQFARLCEVLGLAGAAADPRFASNADRVAQRPILVPLLEAATRRTTRGDLLAALEAAGVPAGPINSLDDVFADPQILHRGMRIAADGVPGLRMPVVFSESDLADPRPAPALGEHTAEVLAELEGP